MGSILSLSGRSPAGRLAADRPAAGSKRGEEELRRERRQLTIEGRKQVDHADRPHRKGLRAGD